MADIKTFLYNDSLKNFVESVNLNLRQKKFLLSKIPEMDLKERKDLFKTLTGAYLLNRKESESLKRVEKFWEK